MNRVVDATRSHFFTNLDARESFEQCLNPILLHILSIFGVIDGALNTEEVTNDNIKEKFYTIQKKKRKRILGEVRSFFHSVAFYNLDCDNQAGVTDFVLSMVAVLDKSNAL